MNPWERGPECRFAVQLGTSEDGCLQAAEYRHNHWNETCDEVDRRGQRLRETCQILVAEIGAAGPCDAEDAARSAVMKIRRLSAEVERLEELVGTMHIAAAQRDAELSVAKKGGTT